MEELELTFLAKELPEGIKKSEFKDMLDIYIPSAHDHPVLRIRKQGDRHEITKKVPIDPNDASRQLESTIALTEEEYAELSQLQGKRIIKTRYYYQEGGVDFEIDVFRGGLEGLVLVDVEFATVENKNSFTPPTWCLAEITQEHFIAGGMLCGKKYSDIEPELQKFGYSKLSF